MTPTPTLNHNHQDSLAAKLMLPVLQQDTERLKDICFSKISDNFSLLMLFQLAYANLTSQNITDHLDKFSLDDLLNNSQYTTYFGHNLFQWAKLNNAQLFLDYIYSYYVERHPNDLRLIIACNQTTLIQATSEILNEYQFMSSALLAFNYGNLPLLMFLMEKLGKKQLLPILLFDDNGQLITRDCLFPDVLHYLLEQFITPEFYQNEPTKLSLFAINLVGKNKTRNAIGWCNALNITQRISQENFHLLFNASLQQKNIYFFIFLFDQYLTRFPLSTLQTSDDNHQQHAILELFVLLLLSQGEYELLKEFREKYSVPLDFFNRMVDICYKNNQYEFVIALIFIFTSVLFINLELKVLYLIQIYANTDQQYIKDKIVSLFADQKFVQSEPFQLMVFNIIAKKNIPFLKFLEILNYTFNFFCYIDRELLLNLVPKLRAQLQDYRNLSVSFLLTQSSPIYSAHNMPPALNFEEQVEISPYIMMMMVDDRSVIECLFHHLDINYASPLTHETVLSFMLKQKRYADAYYLMKNGAKCLLPNKRDFFNEFLQQEFPEYQRTTNPGDFLKLIQVCFYNLLSQLQNTHLSQYKKVMAVLEHTPFPCSEFLKIQEPTLDEIKKYFSQLNPGVLNDSETISSYKLQLFITLVTSYFAEISVIAQNMNQDQNHTPVIDLTM